MQRRRPGLGFAASATTAGRVPGVPNLLGRLTASARAATPRTENEADVRSLSHRKVRARALYHARGTTLQAAGKVERNRRPWIAPSFSGRSGFPCDESEQSPACFPQAVIHASPFRRASAPYHGARVTRQQAGRDSRVSRFLSTFPTAFVPGTARSLTSCAGNPPGRVSACGR